LYLNNIILVDDKEIFYLYKRFIDLKPNEFGRISTTQLLNTPEFLYCPFSRFIPYGLNLEALEKKNINDATGERTNAVRYTLNNQPIENNNNDEPKQEKYDFKNPTFLRFVKEKDSSREVK
jgi:hypothetical protein